MMPIEKRRELSSSRLTLRSSSSPSPRAVRNAIGMTMWLETMMESAMASTMIIPVAADSPPMNTSNASSRFCSSMGKARTNMSASGPPFTKCMTPANAIGRTKMLIENRYSGNTQMAF